MAKEVFSQGTLISFKVQILLSFFVMYLWTRQGLKVGDCVYWGWVWWGVRMGVDITDMCGRMRAVTEVFKHIFQSCCALFEWVGWVFVVVLVVVFGGVISSILYLCDV